MLIANIVLMAMLGVWILANLEGRLVLDMSDRTHTHKHFDLHYTPNEPHSYLVRKALLF